jgi:hypothetical protein
MIDYKTGCTNEEITAGIQILVAVAEAIREKGEVPSGELYAVLSGHLTLALYTKVIERLKGAGLVSERNHLLTWIGPQKDEFAKEVR